MDIVTPATDVLFKRINLAITTLLCTVAVNNEIRTTDVAGETTGSVISLHLRDGMTRCDNQNCIWYSYTGIDVNAECIEHSRVTIHEETLLLGYLTTICYQKATSKTGPENIPKSFMNLSNEHRGRKLRRLNIAKT
jgi:hypothetical protein